jgi:hypothetical protein
MGCPWVSVPDPHLDGTDPAETRRIAVNDPESATVAAPSVADGRPRPMLQRDATRRSLFEAPAREWLAVILQGIGSRSSFRAWTLATVVAGGNRGSSLGRYAARKTKVGHPRASGVLSSTLLSRNAATGAAMHTSAPSGAATI